MAPPFAQARIEALLAHSAWMGSLARRLADDPGTADDLVQKTWLAALEHRAADDGDRRSLRRWLAAVLRNFARQERRGRGRRADHEQRAARDEAQPSTSDVVERASVQRELVQAVLGLPEPYRTTILLRFFDGLPPRAIAKRMGVPVDTVRTRVTRGVAQLRARLDDGRGGDRTAWLAALAPLLRTPSPLVPPPLSTLGAALVNAKIQIAVAALVVGGALTLYLATRAPEPEKSAIAAAAPAAEPSATVEPRAPSSAALAAEAPAGTAAATRGPAPMATTQAAIPEVQAGPAMLRGRVLDDGGAPLSGVRIAAAADGGKLTGDAATSAQDGAFEMSYPQRAERLVSADERFATVFAGLCGGTPSAGEIVVVVAPRVEVAGRVVGEEGYPLPGARVELEVPEEVRTRFRAVLDRSMRLSWQVAADAHGEFAVPAAPRVAGAILHAASDGYVPFSGALEEHSGPGLVITLARPRSEDGLLRGKVLDAGGSPVSTAHVALGVDTTRTEGDGTFSFRLADPDSFAARFRVPPREIVAVQKGFLPARYEPPLVDGEPSWPAFVVLRLGETPLAIEGRVVDAHGDPFSGASVWIADATLFGAGRRGPEHVENLLAGEEEAIWRRIQADGGGRFRIDGLLPRDYRLRAMDGDTLLIAEAGPFAAGTLDAEIRLPTDELYEKVAGRVLSHAGKPVAGARIFPMCDAFQARLKGQIFSTSHERLDGTTTGADGRFELERVPKSLVYLRVEGEDILPLEYGRYVEGDRRFQDTAVRELPKDRIGSLEIVVDLRCHLQVELADPTSADEVSVLDEAGKPLVINVIAGNSRRETERAAIVEGRSFPMAVSDSGRTIVLFKQGLEISRARVELTPGELKQVRL